MPRAKGGRAIWCGAFAIALLLYVATANRGAQTQDSGWQQLRIVTGQLEHPYGFPLYHPLHFYLGRAAIWPGLLEPAFAITLTSSLAAAIAIANITLTLVLLTRKIAPALVAAGALMLSHTFWQHATYTESYALVAALLSGEWLCLTYFVTAGGGARYLLLLALLNGLGISNHLLASLATPVDVVVIIWALRRGQLSGRLAIVVGLLWLAGTLPYSGLVVADLVRTHDVLGTIHAALLADYGREVLNVRVGGRALLLSFAYVLYNFPGLTLPLALVGMWTGSALFTPLKRALLAQLGLFLVFVARYSIADQYTFFFPVYMLLTLFAGIGLARLLTAWSGIRRRGLLVTAAILAAWTPLFYVATARTLASRGSLAGMVKNKPYRDGYRAFFIPWGLGADHATKLIDAVRALVGDDGLVLVADHMQVFALRYAQVIGRLPAGVTVQMIRSHATEEELADVWRLAHDRFRSERAVVLVPTDRDSPSPLIRGARWERQGDIYRLASLSSP